MLGRKLYKSLEKTIKAIGGKVHSQSILKVAQKAKAKNKINSHNHPKKIPT
jgi:DNA repair protein RadC